MGVTLHSYGFLAGPQPIAFPTNLLMGKDLTLKRFSNFATATVRDPVRLAAALGVLEQGADHPLLRTKIGHRFSLDEVELAMAYEAAPGQKAVLKP